MRLGCIRVWHPQTENCRCVWTLSTIARRVLFSTCRHRPEASGGQAL